MDKNLMPYLAKFSNQKFKIAFERICSRLEEKSEEFTVDDVTQSFESATAYIDKLQILRPDKKGAHRLSKTIVEKRDSRHQSLLSLKGRVAYFLKSPVDSELKAALELNSWLNKFSKDLSRPSLEDQSEMVRNMSNDLALYVSISSALESLALFDTWNVIQSETSEILHFQAIRAKERVELVLKGQEVRRIAYDMMKMLHNTIETAVKLEKGDIAKHLEYLRIINVAIADTKSLHLNSKTRRINAAEKAAEQEKQNALPKNGAQSNSTQSAGMQNRSAFSFVPTNETEEHDDLASQEAAMQSKTIEGGAVSTIPVNGDQEHDTAEKPEMPIAKHDAPTSDSDRES